MVIGLGGEGSWFVKELMRYIELGVIPADLNLLLVDGDMVEPKNIKPFQYYDMEDIGQNKAKATYNKYKDQDYGLNLSFMPERIVCNNALDIDGTDRTYILCVDNDYTRKLVIDYCYKNNHQFIDMRCSGSRYLILPKTTQEESDKFISEENFNKEYSCQEAEFFVKADKHTKYQLGHRISSLIGLQMLLNIIRGKRNYPMTAFI